MESLPKVYVPLQQKEEEEEQWVEAEAEEITRQTAFDWKKLNDITFNGHKWKLASWITVF